MAPVNESQTVNRAYTPGNHHAIVHTATVDVKVIRLDKRQMTLSVFRQLDNESIFMSDGTLRGTPWGRVNYLWGDQERLGVAFHVVWQDGDRLKRCYVPALGACDKFEKFIWDSADYRTQRIQDTPEWNHREWQHLTNLLEGLASDFKKIRRDRMFWPTKLLFLNLPTVLDDLASEIFPGSTRFWKMPTGEWSMDGERTNLDHWKGTKDCDTWKWHWYDADLWNDELGDYVHGPPHPEADLWFRLSSELFQEIIDDLLSAAKAARRSAKEDVCNHQAAMQRWTDEGLLHVEQFEARVREMCSMDQLFIAV